MKALSPLFFAALVLVACKAPKEDSPIEVAFSPEDEKREKINTECFQYVSEKDTINMITYVDGTNISGSLISSMFEMEHTSGTIEGEIRDQMIIAEYTYLDESKGDSTKRQIIFKNTEDGWKEGHGKMNSVDGILAYDNIETLDFNHVIALTPIPCE